MIAPLGHFLGGGKRRIRGLEKLLFLSLLFCGGEGIEGGEESKSNHVITHSSADARMGRLRYDEILKNGLS